MAFVFFFVLFCVLDLVFFLDLKSRPSSSLRQSYSIETDQLASWRTLEDARAMIVSCIGLENWSLVQGCLIVLCIDI